MESVPFSIKSAYEGFAEVEGLLRFAGDVLTLEYTTKDSLFGVIKSKVKTIHLGMDDVASLDFAKTLFSGALVLQLAALEPLVDLPGSQGASVRLGVARKHYDVARSIASRFRLRASEIRLEAAQSRLRGQGATL